METTVHGDAHPQKPPNGEEHVEETYSDTGEGIGLLAILMSFITFTHTLVGAAGIIMMISETVTGSAREEIVTALHQRYGADDVVFPDGDRLPSEKDPLPG